MENATVEMVEGVTLEAIVPPRMPDTESLLGEIGSLYPVVTCPVADAYGDELDAGIMAGLLWP